MKDFTSVKPFLKWAGGKSQLADVLVAHLPAEFNVYHEPFVGGGALFFRLYRSGRIKNAVLSDINAELIDTYTTIRNQVEALIELLSEFPYNREFYYALRGADTELMSMVERAARMIYLNKTGYNGLYRVNKQGKFNVPFGDYKSPKYLDRENLLAVSHALKHADILCASFETVLERARAGDLVYFDPPYVPLSRTSSFTSYHAGGFGIKDHQRLRDVCIALSEKGVYVALSNSDTSVTRSLYTSSKFILHEVWANRAINSKGSRRGKVAELIITNYFYGKIL